MLDSLLLIASCFCCSPGSYLMLGVAYLVNALGCYRCRCLLCASLRLLSPQPRNLVASSPDDVFSFFLILHLKTMEIIEHPLRKDHRGNRSQVSSTASAKCKRFFIAWRFHGSTNAFIRPFRPLPFQAFSTPLSRGLSKASSMQCFNISTGLAVVASLLPIVNALACPAFSAPCFCCGMPRPLF